MNAEQRHQKATKRVSRTAVLFFSLIVISAAIAQLPTATVLGVVKDSSGAVMPKANLTARNVETGQTRTTVASGDGSYRFAALPVGSYEIRVENPGFESAIRRGLTLTVGQEAVVDFTLQVGAVEQTVAVTAEAPMVNTTSGSLGGLVGEQTVADLPLNGRNYADLTLLQPGITQYRSFSLGTTVTGTLFSSNGAPIAANNYLLDGAIMQAWHGLTTASFSNSTLGVEGIREWRMVTNAFSAEYGLTMGSQIMIVSKSGTNTFHGSAFEYLRNSALDARNFFDYQTIASSGRLPPFKRNNFGGSFGGPIKKNKTFLFGVYEVVRQRLGLTTISNTIPVSYKVDGGLVPQIAPTIKPLLALYPNPNLPNNQLTFPFTQPSNEQYGQMRVDQNFSTNDSMFARYTIDHDELTSPLAFPQFSQTSVSRYQYGTLSENHVFSPSLLNTARFSYSRSKTSLVSPSGITGPQYSFVPGLEIGTINIGAVSLFGPAGTAPNAKLQNIRQWSDDLFYTRGRHSLKFGGSFNRWQTFSLNGTNKLGQATFPSITSFLLAQPSTFTAITPGAILDRLYGYNTFASYLQDDLRVRSNLTLNLGLRYEFLTQLDELHGHGAALRDVQHDAVVTPGPPFENPSLHNFSPRFGFAWDVTGNGKTAVRGGFAWLYDISNMAGGLSAGVGATPPFASLSTIVNAGNFNLPFSFPPGTAGKVLRTVDYLVKQPSLLSYNLTVERQLPSGMAVTFAYAGSRGRHLPGITDGNPTVPLVLPDGRQFWSGSNPYTNPNWQTIEFYTAQGNSWYNSLQAGLSKRLSRGLQFQASYTFSKTIDQPQSQEVSENNATSSWMSDPSRPLVDKGLAAFDTPHNFRFNAIYRLPELTSGGALEKKMLNGWWVSGILSLQSGYPFSPSLSSNRSRSKVGSAAAGIDRPDLVPGRNKGNITSGTSTGCLVANAQGVLQGVPAGTKLGTPNLYLDPCAFTIPAAGFLGTSGRDILRGPSFTNLDFSLVKDTALRFLGESGKLQFRAEFFNILNHANFTTPGIGASGGNNAAIVFAALNNVEAPLASAGRITSTAGTSRQVQFALKILF